MIYNGIKKLSEWAFVSVVYVLTRDVDGSSLTYFVAERILRCGLGYNFASFGCHSNFVADCFEFVVVLYIRETCVPVFRN